MSKPPLHPDLPPEIDTETSVEDADDLIQDLHAAVDHYHHNAKNDIQTGTSEAYGTIRELEGQMPDVNTIN